MAYYNSMTQPERATPDSNGGCLSGILFLPFSALLMSLILILLLSRVNMNADATAPVMTAPEAYDPLTFVSPYDWYVVTQGLHGYSYGHMAVDIAGGKGAPIYSPINGAVSDLFTDGLGNPVLVIENEVYRVTMMHGVYAVLEGDVLQAGEFVGTESNLGNTTDMQGISCRNRDCGYHTHLNVFDKRVNANVNPLTLITP